MTIETTSQQKDIPRKGSASRPRHSYIYDIDYTQYIMHVVLFGVWGTESRSEWGVGWCLEERWRTSEEWMKAARENRCTIVWGNTTAVYKLCIALLWMVEARRGYKTRELGTHHQATNYQNHGGSEWGMGVQKSGEEQAKSSKWMPQHENIVWQNSCVYKLCAYRVNEWQKQARTCNAPPATN